MDEYNLGDKEEDEKPQDVMYLVLKGVLKKLATKV